MYTDHAPDKARGRILVIDDTPSNLRLLMTLLAQQGYVVHPATSGPIALRFLQTTQPDLILLDAIMPGMDGYEVCKRLKADTRTRDIPVVFISAVDQPLNKVRAFACGCVDYIVKPFQAEEVLARIGTHLALHNMQKFLEERVTQRTAELQAANTRLQIEIAERKLGEEALRERVRLQDQIAKVAASVPGVICSFLWRPNGSCCMPYASAALEDTCGLRPCDVAEDGSRVFAIVHPDDLAHLRATLAESASTLQPWRAEYRIRHPIKGEVWLEGHSVPQRQPDGSILWHGYIRDITEMVTSRHAIEEAGAAAERANDAKTRFLAAASHDLRQPVQSMRLLLSVLPRKLDDPQQMLDICARMDEVLGTTETMLSRLMEFASLESGGVTVKREAFRLDELLHHLADESADEAAAKGLRLRIRSFPCTTESDPVLLARILRNLVSNAIRYTEKGGILLGIRRRRGALQIEVRDTGIGIPENKREAIFEEFTQLANPERDRTKGAGLGLAIAARTAQLLGHPLTLESTVGMGSLFEITVPEVRSRQRGHAASPVIPGRPKKSRILVVEDDYTQAVALEMLLSDIGHEIRVAHDGLAALKTIAQAGRPPDLMITDYRLPGDISGIELVERARAEAHRTFPAILVTGDTQAHIAEAAHQTGCVVLHKPYNTSDLLSLLNRSLAGK